MRDHLANRDGKLQRIVSCRDFYRGRGGKGRFVPPWNHLVLLVLDLNDELILSQQLLSTVSWNSAPSIFWKCSFASAYFSLQKIIVLCSCVGDILPTITIYGKIFEWENFHGFYNFYSITIFPHIKPLYILWPCWAYTHAAVKFTLGTSRRPYNFTVSIPGLCACNIVKLWVGLCNYCTDMGVGLLNCYM